MNTQRSAKKPTHADDQDDDERDGQPTAGARLRACIARLSLHVACPRRFSTSALSRRSSGPLGREHHVRIRQGQLCDLAALARKGDLRRRHARSERTPGRRCASGRDAPGCSGDRCRDENRLVEEILLHVDREVIARAGPVDVLADERIAIGRRQRLRRQSACPHRQALRGIARPRPHPDRRLSRATSA